MRKYIEPYGVFYYPEEHVNLIDTEELKIIVENPTGYGVGDSVRLIYTFAPDDVEVGINTFEMFSPLVNFGGVRRAIFYIPLPAEFANDSISFSPGLKQTDFIIKTKGSTDFDPYTNFLNRNYSFIYLTNSNPNVRSNPIPVFFFSERGAGLFANKILNRQFRAADTNFSSVAIRQDKFNPFDMKVEGRNLLRNSSFEGTAFYTLATINGGINTISGEYAYEGSKAWKCVTGGSTNSSGGHIQISGLEIGGTYTFSVRVMSLNAAPVEARILTTNWQTVKGQKATLEAGIWQRVSVTFQATADTLRLAVLNGTYEYPTYYIDTIKLELGNRATDWTPAPEDYEVREVVSGAELAEGMDKFNASYAFKLLDDSGWVTKKLVCPENYIQLFWGEPRSATRFSFWFEIKEIEKSSETWGEVEHDRELRIGGDIKERRKDVTKYRFPKTKLRLTSGVFRQDIIDQLKGIVHSPTIYRYNPYSKLNEGRGVIAQVTELRDNNGMPTAQIGTGHFRLDYINNRSNTIEELIRSPESAFDLEFSVKGQLAAVQFVQNRDDLSIPVLISSVISESNFTKKTFEGAIVIDRSKKVKPALIFLTMPNITTEIKDIYIKGNLGGIEDVEVEIATMNIIPHQDGESEMELTVISDDFRKPDYLYF